MRRSLQSNLQLFKSGNVNRGKGELIETESRGSRSDHPPTRLNNFTRKSEHRCRFSSCPNEGNDIVIREA